MFVLGLLTCIVLRAFSAQAKVVTSFNECSEFFYKGTEPEGMDQNAKKICQKNEQRGSYYATLYSVHHRIPLYSAYTFDLKGSTTGGRTDIWHLEPQISQPESQIDYMVRENQNNQNTYKRYQAISSDYRDTGYDRGHLKPSFFSRSEEGREATFTLTNAAPMDACFNRIHWYKWEITLKSFLNYKLASDNGLAKAYIVTGTVPDVRERIPDREKPEDSERVTVPSHIWTAVCYKHYFDNRKSLSFGFIGKNQPEEPGISLMSVSTLNNRLTELYSELLTFRSINIFYDECFGDNDLDEVEERFKKLMPLPVKVAMASAVRNTYNTLKRAVSSYSVPAKKVRVSELIAKLVFDSLSIYFSIAEELKIFSKGDCLIINAKKSISYGDVDLRKREVSEGSDAVECLLVPEKQKTAADGSPCVSVTDSSDSCECTSGKPCCSTPCLYQHKLKGYRCYSGQKRIECSPRYSLITVKGERCLDDHPCATYGYDYYWCKTGLGYVKDDWGYCSPPLWRSKAENGKNCRSDHACAKYGESQPWCYTDDGKKNKCCTYDDCFSAVNGKTCKPDHPCGYHGKKYLWCYTTYGKWDYCCTFDCRKMISS
ncbi:uncharacterized protein LOC125246018 [Megalobrama amblycephala]|uniref:uncharacterized protein LOC125246018 n=1 Tax=Megalobrama amblycephala TaxID=75352 RepID=UPI002013DF89|nr:uncharacterized protein LOC125246018 [Megalobrama amblycephala]